MEDRKYQHKLQEMNQKEREADFYLSPFKKRAWLQMRFFGLDFTPETFKEITLNKEGDFIPLENYITEGEYKSIVHALSLEYDDIRFLDFNRNNHQITFEVPYFKVNEKNREKHMRLIVRSLSRVGFSEVRVQIKGRDQKPINIELNFSLCALVLSEDLLPVIAAYELLFKRAQNVQKTPMLIEQREWREKWSRRYIPKQDIKLTSIPVKAKARKLRTRWTIETQENDVNFISDFLKKYGG